MYDVNRELRGATICHTPLFTIRLEGQRLLYQLEHEHVLGSVAQRQRHLEPSNQRTLITRQSRFIFRQSMFPKSFCNREGGIDPPPAAVPRLSGSND
jgi:hypothetical protein